MVTPYVTYINKINYNLTIVSNCKYNTTSQNIQLFHCTLRVRPHWTSQNINQFLMINRPNKQEENPILTISKVNNTELKILFRGINITQTLLSDDFLMIAIMILIAVSFVSLFCAQLDISVHSCHSIHHSIKQKIRNTDLVKILKM